MSTSDISKALAEHYAASFEAHGASPRGVDWGSNPQEHLLRLDRMLAVTQRGTPAGSSTSLLDVGCGFGSLLDRSLAIGLPLVYTGIDICEPMVEAARQRHPNARWMASDILTAPTRDQHDYVVCNGILTQKLGASIRDMDQFLKALVRQMFSLCKVGIAFNVMTSHVNFTAPNLYYRNPAELLAWCMSEISTKVILDHAYPLFEYTVYIYREDAPGMQYGLHHTGGAA
ncbi:MAG: class I SAM-dependent methyltransferase [Bacteroidota bacterium]|nr:class I SAM-dependent methyltransferase [Bacteroidota bacterium]